MDRHALNTVAQAQQPTYVIEWISDASTVPITACTRTFFDWKTLPMDTHYEFNIGRLLEVPDSGTPSLSQYILVMILFGV